FLGGALLAPADFAAMRWLALREALTRQTHLKAAFHVFVRLQGVSWVAFAAAFLLAIANDDGHMAGIIFAAWAAACLACDYLLIRRCQQWIAGGFRARATAAVRPVVAGAGVDG